MRAPEIETSTEAERRQYIKNAFPCIADCEMCGLCTVFRGKRPGTCLYRLYQWKAKLFRGIPGISIKETWRNKRVK